MTAYIAVIIACKIIAPNDCLTYVEKSVAKYTTFAECDAQIPKLEIDVRRQLPAGVEFKLMSGCIRSTPKGVKT